MHYVNSVGLFGVQIDFACYVYVCVRKDIVSACSAEVCANSEFKVFNYRKPAVLSGEQRTNIERILIEKSHLDSKSYNGLL